MGISHDSLQARHPGASSEASSLGSMVEMRCMELDGSQVRLASSEFITFQSKGPTAQKRLCKPFKNVSYAKDTCPREVDS